MSPDSVSASVLAFVQRSQVAVGVCVEQDYAAQVSALWTWMAELPRARSEAERMAAAVAVCRISAGFFLVGDIRVAHAPVQTGGGRRRNVNMLLRYTRENYASADLTLGDVARRMDLSIAYLSRALAAETGHAFRTHLNGIRLCRGVSVRDDQEVRRAAVGPDAMWAVWAVSLHAAGGDG
jgi:AraC-like DNA-binding protein